MILSRLKYKWLLRWNFAHANIIYPYDAVETFTMQSEGY